MFYSLQIGVEQNMERPLLPRLQFVLCIQILANKQVVVHSVNQAYCKAFIWNKWTEGWSASQALYMRD